MSEPNILFNGHRNHEMNINEMDESNLKDSDITNISNHLNSIHNEPINSEYTFIDDDVGDNHLKTSKIHNCHDETFNSNNISEVNERSRVTTKSEDEVENAKTRLYNLNLALIEAQARDIETQKKEIARLKKENDELKAKLNHIERRNSTTICSPINCNVTSTPMIKGGSPTPKQSTDSKDFLTNNSEKSIVNGSLDGDYESGVGRSVIRHVKDKSQSNNKSMTNDAYSIVNSIIQSTSPINKINDQSKSSFCLKILKNLNPTFISQRPKGTKSVRFVEAKKRPSTSNVPPSMISTPKRACVQTANNAAKSKLDNAVSVVKTEIKRDVTTIPAHVSNNHEHAARHSFSEASTATTVDDCNAVNKKRIKVNILTTKSPYHVATRVEYDPVTYTPASLEVPSFRIIEKDSTIDDDLPPGCHEDISLAAASDRHQRFESDEKKRKKWDVQRIRELHHNERLKERMRKQKSRWNDSPPKHEGKKSNSDHISSLFPDIRCIEKIMINDTIPVTALGHSIPKVPTWGVEFHNKWKNDGTVNVTKFRSSKSQHHQHHPSGNVTTHHRDSARNHHKSSV